MSITTRALHLLAAALCVGATTTAQNNVLLILADDIGVDNISVYAEGTNPPPTPTIDSLASNGVLFRNAWANPMCSPTRACILTGRHGTFTGVGHVLPSAPLPLVEITLPEQLDLRQSGYAHAAIGKWHVSFGATAPNDAGWSHFAGDTTGLNNYFSWTRTVNGVVAPSTNYATTEMVDDALAWIQGQTTPWVCYLALQSAHAPFHAPPANLHTQNLDGLDPNTDPLPFYRAMIEAMDTEIGRLLASLGPALANTNVIFSTDNGTLSALAIPPFKSGKGSPFEGGINVPLIVSGPAVNSPGRESPHLVHAVDLYSTVLELAGVEPEPPFAHINGRSLVPYLSDPAATPLRNSVYAELFDSTSVDFSAIRNQQYKLIRYRFGETPADLFYDLLADPFENSNLLAAPLTPTQQANFNALSLAMSEVRNPAGGFTKYGTGCTSSVGVPSVHGQGTPEPGNSYNVLLENAPPATPAILMIGGSDKYWGQLPLPLPMAAFGANPSCQWLASPDLYVLTSTDATGTALQSIAVPNLYWFESAFIRHQWLLIDQNAPANPAGLVTTDGLRVRLGR